MDDEPDDKDDSKRRIRNQSEKKRRDQFNNLVNELSTMVSPNNRKMDKTTVLKTTISYLKNHNENTARSKANDVQEAWKPEFLCNEEFTYLIMEAIEGFIMVFSTSGRIYYVSESIASLLGHHPVDVINNNIYEMINEDDRGDLYNVIHNSIAKLDTMPNNTSERGIRFQYYMKRGTGKTDEGSVYDLVRFEGHFRVNTDHVEKGPMGYQHDVDSRILFVCTGRLYTPKLVRDVSLIDPECNEFSSRHSLEWKFLFLDHRGPPIIGYLPFEVLGTSGFDYYHFDDLERVSECHQELMEKGEVTSSFYRFLTKGQQWIWLQTRFYITYHQWSSKPEFVVGTHRVISYADLVRKRKPFQSDASEGDNQPRRGRLGVASDTRGRDCSPSLFSDKSDAMTQKSSASNGSGSMSGVSLVSGETSVSILSDENGEHNGSCESRGKGGSGGEGNSSGTGVSNEKFVCGTNVHTNKHGASNETVVNLRNGVCGEISDCIRNCISSESGVSSDEGVSISTGVPGGTCVSGGTGVSGSTRGRTGISRGDGGTGEFIENGESRDNGASSRNFVSGRASESSVSGVSEESRGNRLTGESRQKESNKNRISSGTGEPRGNCDTQESCESNGTAESKENGEPGINSVSGGSGQPGKNGASGDFRGYIETGEFRGYGGTSQPSVSGAPGATVTAWNRFSSQAGGYPNGYQTAAYMSGDARSPNPPAQTVMQYPHMPHAPKVEQPMVNPQSMGCQYMETGQYMAMDGVPMTLGRPLQMPMLMSDDPHFQMLQWPRQEQLQRKQEELQQMIMRQQEELRQVKEQLLLATLGILPPLINMQGTYINPSDVQQANPRMQMAIQVPLQIQPGLVFETSPGGGNPGLGYPQHLPANSHPNLPQ